MSSPPITPQASPVRSVRLIFEYDGDQVHLVSQQEVDMVVTGFDLAQAPSAGVYLEARDTQGRALARVPARGAFHASAEVFPEHVGEPITRVEVARPKGAFTVVVPAAAAARQVTLVRVKPAKPKAGLAPGAAASAVADAAEVTDLASFPLQLKP